MEETGQEFEWDRDKLVKYGIIGLAVLILALMIILINIAYTNNKVNRLVSQTEAAVNERVAYNVQQYLSSYLEEDEAAADEQTATNTENDSAENSHTTTVEKTTVSTTTSQPVTLTQQQIDTITQIVKESTKKEVIREVLVETADSDIESRLDEFEKEIMQKVTEVLNEYSVATGGLTEAEVTSLINSISAIVKSDILATVKEKYYDINAANIEVLRKSIEVNMANIQQQFDSYDLKFSSIKTQIAELSASISSGETNTDELEAQLKSINRKLVSLTSEYNSFTARALTTSMIVDDLTKEVENGVVSAKAGKELQDGLNDTRAELEALVTTLDQTARQLSSQINLGDAAVKKNLIERMLSEDSELESKLIYQMTTGDSVLQEKLLEQMVSGDESLQESLLIQIANGDSTLAEQLKEQIANGDTTLKELLQKEIAEGNLTLQEVLEKEIAEGDITLRDILNKQIEDGNLSLQELIASVDEELSTELQEQVNLLNENISLTETNLSGDIQDLGDTLSNVNASLSSTLNQITSALGAEEIMNYSYSTTVLTRVAAMEVNLNNASTDISGLENRILALETTVSELCQQLNINVKQYDASTRTLHLQSVSVN